MSAYVRLISDRLDFLEFKQNILLLKQPQHKASVFHELKLEDFLKIRDFSAEIEEKILSGIKVTISDYEKELFIIWPPIKMYPSASTLVAKALMSEDNFSTLFKYFN